MVCPVCKRDSLNGIKTKFIDDIVWLKCSCGSFFQQEPTEKPLSDEYVASYKSKKFYTESAIYPYTIYFPIIEEATFGRRILEIDSYDNEVAKQAYDRGWISYATGKIKTDKIRVTDELFEDLKLEKNFKFDCIYSYHKIGKAKDYKQVLQKYYDALSPQGLLFIADPDSTFVDSLGVADFTHWYIENKIIFNRKQMEKELEKVGFEIIVSRSNDSSRFIKNNDFHIIAQRRV